MKRFDVFWVQMDPAKGTEIQKTRPAVIISPDEMNDRIQRVIIAPLTSRIRPLYSYRLQVTVNKTASDVLLDQIRAVDKRRLSKQLDRLQLADQNNLIHLLQQLFAA
jgi:mRNA interferase MazF